MTKSAWFGLGGDGRNNCELRIAKLMYLSSTLRMVMQGRSIGELDYQCTREKRSYYNGSLTFSKLLMNVQLVESIRSLIQSLPKEERGALRSSLIQTDDYSRSTLMDLNEFSGVIQLQQDPLEYQRQMRDEWIS